MDNGTNTIFGGARVAHSNKFVILSNGKRLRHFRGTHTMFKGTSAILGGARLAHSY